MNIDMVESGAPGSDRPGSSFREIDLAAKNELPLQEEESAGVYVIPQAHLATGFMGISPYFMQAQGDSLLP